MDEFSFSATVTVGSLIGAMIQTPDESPNVIIIFLIVNAMVSLLGYSVIGAVLAGFRGNDRRPR